MTRPGSAARLVPAVDAPKQAPAPVVSRTFGPEALVAVVRHANFRATQLGVGDSPSTLAHVRCPQVSLDMLELGSAMLFKGAMAADLYTITAIIRCPTPGHSYNFASAFADGCIGFYPPGGQAEAMIPRGYGNATLTIPGDRFRQAVDTCFPELPAAVLRHGAGMKVPAPEFRAVQRLVEIVRATMADPEQPLASALAREHLEAELMAAFLTALRGGCGLLVPPPDVRIGRRYQLLARARELVDAHLTEPMPIDRLCAELGLSRRSLEYLFNDLLGISPAVYLKRMRLNGVRAALLRSEPERGIVKRLALDWGFWHWGHFSKDYGYLFGESPACTCGKQPACR
ncbi:MAG: helix-turn-helix domain-containing protein [Akkermansiaceae bacterium]|nr:helix-turn-helix domain-containing protein [Akkermansiaceae bacterium]